MQFQKQPLQRHRASQWLVCSAAVTIVGNTALTWPTSGFLSMLICICEREIESFEFKYEIPVSRRADI